MKSVILLGISLFSACSWGIPVAKQAQSVSIRQLYAYPNGTTIENLAVRSDGQILLTSTTAPRIALLDPKKPSTAPQVLYTFPNATVTVGITEVSPNRFAIVTSRLNATAYNPGSSEIWTLDFNKPDQGRTFTAKQIVAVTDSGLLNGLTTLPGSDNILAADSLLGKVFKINTVTGKYSAILSDPAFAPSDTFPLGVNGVHLNEKADRLYFTNSATPALGSVPVNSKGERTGATSIITTEGYGGGFDDFALMGDSKAFIADLGPNAIVEVDVATGKTSKVNGTGQQAINGPTSAAFARGRKDVLYVTSGNPRGSQGQVLEIRLS